MAALLFPLASPGSPELCPAQAALAHEALTEMPTALLVILLRDPVDAPIAHMVLERQAVEYGSADAKRALRDFEDSRFDF